MKKMSLYKSAAMAPIALAFAATAASAQADENAYQLTVINDCINECGFPDFANQEEAVAYLRAQFANDGEGASSGAGGSVEGANGPSGLGLGLGLGLNSPQTVFLSFETGDPTYTYTLFGITITLNDYVYSDEEKELVKSRFEADYAPYNIEFVLEEPTEGDYVTMQFNSNDNPGNGTAGILPNGGILFGSAGEIDFGNDNRSIVAINDANLWPFLNALDIALGRPEGTFLEDNVGIDVIGARTDGDNPVTPEEAARISVLNQTSNTGAHELGHGLGLRHYDAYGPIGGGLPDTGVPNPAAWAPVYTGPQDGDETTMHLMASGASSGLSLAQAANADRFLSERSAIKLTINERGRFVTDEQANSGQAKLKKLNVVNPVVEGDNADGRIDVRNIVIEGRLDELDEVDTFTFNGKAGQVFNAELISEVEAFFFPDWDRMIGRLQLFLQNGDGTETLVSVNDAEFESFDAFMLDTILPEDGTYVLKMDAPNEIFLGFDANGDPIIIPLAVFGQTEESEYRIGQYIVNAHIVESKNGNGPSTVGGPSN